MSEKTEKDQQNPKAAEIDKLEVTELEDEDMEDVSGGDTNSCNIYNNVNPGVSPSFS